MQLLLSTEKGKATNFQQERERYGTHTPPFPRSDPQNSCNTLSFGSLVLSLLIAGHPKTKIKGLITWYCGCIQRAPKPEYLNFLLLPLAHSLPTYIHILYVYSGQSNYVYTIALFIFQLVRLLCSELL